MRDLIGRTLGHYRIVEKIGAGGMGEVYRAHDERLDREVAIKVLSEAVAGVQDRLERFEREAKLLASLNHPNIATLHGLEEEDRLRYLVMELVEGESLANVIARGPIPFDEALAIALQIAQALETAHEHGVIHRDLKPANVMVDSEGRVRVLDFGLAKAFDPEISGSMSQESLAESPTLTADLTRGGVLLGTAAYMSPEQARGRPVDKRADVWAFGCVLYEMLSGARAFSGATSTEVLAAVIKEDPSWEELPAETPTSTCELLRRCLTKDPRDRFHDIADARIMLQEIIERPSEPALDEAGTTAQHKALPRLAVTAAAILVAVALTVLTMSSIDRGRTTVGKSTTRFAINLPVGLQLYMSGSRNPVAISPDGEKVVFVAIEGGTRQLYLRPTSVFDAAPIADTAGAVCPVFSPDGNSIAFFAGGKLKRISLSDGSVATVCDAAITNAICWTSNNRILFVERGRARLFSVPATGGQPEIVPMAGTDVGLLTFISVSEVHGSDSIFLTVTAGGGLESKRIDIVSATTGERRTLIQGGYHGQLSPSNHLVFSRGNSLFASPFNPDRLEVSGPEVPVFQKSTEKEHLSDFPATFRMSESGTLVYVPGVRSTRGEPVWVDRQGRVEGILEEPRRFSSPMLSPDGRRLAVTAIDEVMENWILDLERGALSRFTFQKGNHFNVWTPDGKHIAFSSDRDGPFNLYMKPADGSGSTVRLTESDWHQDPGSWSPDGRILVFAENHPETSWDIGLAYVGGEPRQETLIKTRFREYHPMISPDGRWLAYVSNETGRYEVYVQPLLEGTGKWLISTRGGTEPLWARSGDELFYRNGDTVMAVAIRSGPDFDAAPPKPLFDVSAQSSGGFGSPNYDITRDGQRFLMIAREERVQQTKLYVVENWVEELERLVPME